MGFSRTVDCAVMVAALFAVLQVPHALGAGAAVTKHEVLTMVEAYIQSVDALHCSFSRTVETVVHPDEHRKETQVEWAWDKLERERYRSVEQQGADTSVSAYSWDGEKLVSLSQFGSRKTSEAAVEARPPHSIDSLGNPLNTCFRFLGRDTISKLHSTKSRLLRVEDADRDRLYVVEFELKAPTAETPGIWTTLWFSQNRGFAPVKAGVRVGEHKWMEQMLDIRQVRPGIWLPTASRARGWLSALPNRRADDYRDGTITKVVIDEERYRVNEEVTEEDFQLALPNGTLVHDKIAGTHYVQGLDPRGGGSERDMESLDDHLADMVAEAKAVMQEEKPEQPSAFLPTAAPPSKPSPPLPHEGGGISLRRWFALACGILLAAAAGLVLFRIKRGA